MSPTALSRIAVVSMLCGLAAVHATAQALEEKRYDGTWSVRLQGPGGAAREATLVLEGYDGTWQDRAGSRAARSACGGKKVPLTVQVSSTTLLAFTVWGETVGPACQTLTVTVKPRGEKVLEGAVDTGSHGSESPEVHASHSLPAPAASSASAGAAAQAPRMGSAGSIRLTRR